jgi:pimeloyl-ACP methyl ester carboxylesterase
VLEPRGSGHSISAAWPRTDSWAGRQEELASLTALDLHVAARALAQAARADTSRIVLGGVGTSAALAIRVAARSPRVAALLLVSPTPRPAEWAPLRAALASRRIPAFFQLALEEHWSTWDESDVLYQAGNTGDSRVVESRGGGHGAAQFQQDEELMPRLSRWLDGLPAARVPASVPRRSAPPKR